MADFKDYKVLEDLVNIDSPTGYTEEAVDFVASFYEKNGIATQKTQKGALVARLGEKPRIALAAHIDTLGAIVSGIKSDGTLKLSLLGGLSLSSAEGEYVSIITLEGKKYTGTLLLDNPSSHANNEREKTVRGLDNMHIRIDEVVKKEEDVQKLGIRTGDFICFEPRYRLYENGFIKSRFMDNKAGCYVLMEVGKRLKAKGKEVPVELFFSNYEEVGHGGTCGYSETVEELLVIDMGVLGKDCVGDELSCSICVKDSTGPYDFSMRKRLVQLAESNSIAHKIDVYPFYGSDGSAAWRAGNDFRVGLIGPGVAASHGVERAHVEGIEATIDLCMVYIEEYLS